MSDVIAPVVIAAVVAFFAGLALERFRRAGVIADARRKAYATWFTSVALICERLRAICEKLSGFPKDIKRHLALTEEILSLASEIKILVTAMNEAYLAEKSWRVRRRLTSLNELLLFITNNLEFAAHHYGKNLEFHELFRLSDEDLGKFEAEDRDRFLEMKKDFEEHDAECPFKSPKFRDLLIAKMSRLEKDAAKLREHLVGTTSK